MISKKQISFDFSCNSSDLEHAHSKVEILNTLYLINHKSKNYLELESYHPYLVPQKVSKIPQTYCIHSILSKNAKKQFWLP
jgi:hypothetical protein